MNVYTRFKGIDTSITKLISGVDHSCLKFIYAKNAGATDSNHNYICYKCDKPMKLSNIEYEKYITLDAISRQKIIEGYMIHS